MRRVRYESAFKWIKRQVERKRMATHRFTKQTEGVNFGSAIQFFSKNSHVIRMGVTWELHRNNTSQCLVRHNGQ